MDIEKIHKLREQCLIRFPLRINQYNHYIEDANGCVIAVVYGTAGNAAPYLVEAANALPELLDEVEMLRKENQEMVREGLAADVEIVKENMRLIEEVERLRKVFQQACDWIHQDSGCPADVFGWGCPHVGENECQENAVECWEQYFLEKARGE